MNGQRFFSELISYGLRSSVLHSNSNDDGEAVSLQDKFDRFNGSYAKVGVYRRNVAAMDFAETLSGLKINTEKLLECELIIKSIKRACAQWNSVDTRMGEAYDVLCFNGDSVSTKFSDSLEIISKIIDGSATEDDKHTLILKLRSISNLVKDAQEPINDAQSASSSFVIAVSQCSEKMANLKSVYISAKGLKQADVDSLKDAVKDAQESVDKCEKALIGCGLGVAGAVILGGLGCFFLPEAAPVILSITTAAVVGGVVGVTVAGVMYSKRQDELLAAVANLNLTQGELTLLAGMENAIDNSVTAAENMIDEYNNINAPWAFLAGGADSVAEWVESSLAGGEEVDYNQMYHDLEEASVVWKRIVDGMKRMVALCPDDMKIITVDDLKSEQSIKAMFARLSA